MYSNCKSVHGFSIRKLRLWISSNHYDYSGIIELYAYPAVFLLLQSRYDQDQCRGEYIMDTSSFVDDGDSEQYAVVDYNLLRYVFRKHKDWNHKLYDDRYCSCKRSSDTIRCCFRGGDNPIRNHWIYSGKEQAQSKKYSCRRIRIKYQVLLGNDQWNYI